MVGSSSCGNSSGNMSQIQNCAGGSETESMLHALMEQRKRKRMQSNRESARRSRMRKQQYMDELMGQVTDLSKQKNQILARLNITRQQYLDLESENSILRALVLELSQRLQSLNEILSFVNSSTAAAAAAINVDYEVVLNDSADPLLQTSSVGHSFKMMNPFSLLYVNQPIRGFF